MLQPDNARILLKHMNLAAVARDAGMGHKALVDFVNGKEVYTSNYLKLVKYLEDRYVHDDATIIALHELMGPASDTFLEAEEDDFEDFKTGGDTID